MSNGTNQDIGGGSIPSQTQTVENVAKLSVNQEPAAGQTEYVSKADFEAAKEELKRYSQSLVDSNISRVDKRMGEAIDRVNQMVEMSKNAGVVLSQEDVKKMMDVAKQKAILSEDNQQAQPQTTQPEPHPATIMAEEYQRHANVFIQKDDPEFNELQLNSTPTAFLDSVKSAIENKKKRLASQPGNLAAIPGATGGGGAPPNIVNQYIEDMKAARGKGYHIMRDIQDKYRKLGVDPGAIGFKI